MKSENLKKFFDEKNIDTVAFDLDNTLFMTSDYFYENTTTLTLKLSSQIDSNKNPQEIIELMDTLLKESYLNRKNRQPLLIDDWYIGALNGYYKNNIPRGMDIEVREFFQDFYNMIPSPYENVDNILKNIFEINRNIVLHSHAQQEWTALKVQKLKELVGRDIPYLATPLEEEKDRESWLKAFKIAHTDPQNVLVVGDNLGADIVPGIQAGAKNAVLINRHDEQIPEEYSNNGDINILTIPDISELFNALK